MTPLTLPDPISYLVPTSVMMEVLVGVLWANALLMAFLAFALTQDAGFHCPLALLRLVHRWFMALFAISLANLGAWLMAYPSDCPPGPVLFVFFCLFLSILPSAVRHSLSPSIPIINTWRGAFQHWLNKRPATSLK